MKEILNDPKTDAYAIPLRVLKRSLHMFKRGMSCEEIARAYLGMIRKMAKDDASLVERLPVLCLPREDQLSVIMTRLEMADQKSPEHGDYKRLLQRLNQRRYNKRRLENMTEAERQVDLAKRRGYMRRYKLENPEVMEENRVKFQSWYQHQKENDPVGHEARLAQQRERYDRTKITPEGKSKMRMATEKFRAKQRARMDADPEYREEVLRKQREYKRRYRQKKKMQTQ